MSDEKGDGPTIVKLEPPNQIHGEVEKFQRNTPHLIQHVRAMAKIRRASYLALVEEGFTEAQALELCKV